MVTSTRQPRTPWARGHEGKTGCPGAQGWGGDEVPVATATVPFCPPGPPNVPQPGAGRYNLPQSPPALLISSPLGRRMEMSHFILTAALQVGTIGPHFTDVEIRHQKGKRLACV